MEILKWVSSAGPMTVLHTIIILLVLLLARMIPRKMSFTLSGDVRNIRRELEELKDRMTLFEQTHRDLAAQLAAVTATVTQIQYDVRLMLETLLKAEKRDAR